MNHYFLLLDFGASYTKSSLLNITKGNLIAPLVFPAMKNIARLDGHYEISPADLTKQFLDICEHYTVMNASIEGVVICSQMHGFILLDQKNKPLTNYISWQDERSLKKIDGISSYEIITQQLGESFKQITGMYPRAGLPIMNVMHLCRSNDWSDKTIKLVTLPEWLALSHETSNHCVHETMIAGTGFFDINQKQISTVLVDMIKQHTRYQLTFNALAKEKDSAGHLVRPGKEITIYTGVGDHQCAILGAENTSDSISINIGTGSQVAQINGDLTLTDFERRPYFNNNYLLTRTHIPAGRALNLYFGFLKSVMKDVWSEVNKLTPDDILQSSLSIDLAFFQSAFNHTSGGMIKKISEDNFTLQNYLASVLKCFLLQYVPLINELRAMNPKAKCILSGGIPRKLPHLTKALACMINAEVRVATKTEETLAGLHTIATSILQTNASKSLFTIN